MQRTSTDVEVAMECHSVTAVSEEEGVELKSAVSEKPTEPCSMRITLPTSFGNRTPVPPHPEFYYDDVISRHRPIANIWQIVTDCHKRLWSAVVVLYVLSLVGLFAVAVTAIAEQDSSLQRDCNPHIARYLIAFAAFTLAVLCLFTFFVALFKMRSFPKLQQGDEIDQMTITVASLLATIVLCNIAVSFYGLYAARESDGLERNQCGLPYIYVRATCITYLLLTTTLIVGYMIFYQILTCRLHATWRAASSLRR